MKRKRTLPAVLLAALALISVSLFAACAKNKAPLLTVDTDEFDVSTKAVVSYVLPSATAVSQNGGEATVEIVGTAPSGKSVAIEGFTATIAELGAHTFTYTAAEGDLRSEPVELKVTFTTPDKPVIYLAATGFEATYRQAKGIEIPAASALSESDDNVAVSVAGKAPDGGAVTVTDGKFDALSVGDYVFTYTAEDAFGTAADPVIYTIHVTEYMLTLDVAETEISVEGAKNIALPEAAVVSSVDTALVATVTVKSAPSGSDFAAGDAVTDFVFTPDMAGEYVFEYVAKDSMGHESDPVDVTVTVRYGAPKVDFTEAFPVSMDEGEEYDVPSFTEMGGSASYEWLGYTTEDFDVSVKASYLPLDTEEWIEADPEEPFVLVAGKVQIEYILTAQDNAEVAGTVTKVFTVSNPAFNDFITTHIKELHYRPGIYDQSYMQITTTAAWGGINLSEDARNAFLAQEGGYMRYLIFNPNGKTLRMVFQHRGPQDGAERYGAIGTEYNTGSKLWEVNLVFQMPAYSYREVIIPREYLGDNCNTVSLWTNNTGDSFIVLDFEILTDEEFAGAAAYDFSEGLPVLTDGEGTPVSDGSATVEQVSYNGDDNALKIVNTGEGSVYADLFGESVDQTQVEKVFSSAVRGQKDAVLTFVITNTGEETVTYKVVAGASIFYTLETVPEYDDYNEPTGKTENVTPTLEAGESRRVEIAVAAMFGMDPGDFTAQLVIEGAGELTFSNFTVREGSFAGYTPAVDTKPQLTVTKTAEWEDVVELTPGMIYTVPVEISCRTFYESETLSAVVTDPRGGTAALVNGAFEPVYTGEYKITWTLTDSRGNKAEQSLTVEFTTDNPVVTVEGGVYEFETEFDKAYALPEAIVLNGDGLEVAVTGVDPDGDPVTVGDDLTFDAGKTGEYVFTYSVEAAGAIPATVTVNVTGGDVTMIFNSMEMPSIIPDHTAFTVPDITAGEYFIFEYNGWTADDFNITQTAFFTTDADAESGDAIVVGEGDEYGIGYIKIRYEGVAKEPLNGKPFSFVKEYTVQVGTVFLTFSSAGSGYGGNGATAADVAVTPENAPSYVPVTPTHDGFSGIDITTSGSPEIEKFLAAEDGYLVMWIYNEKDFAYKLYFGSYVQGVGAPVGNTSYYEETNAGWRWEYGLAVQMPANGYRKLVIPRAAVADNHTKFTMYAVETDGTDGVITTKPVTWRIYDFRYVDEAAAEMTGVALTDLPVTESGTISAYENGFKLSAGSVELAENAALAPFMKNEDGADEKAYVLSFAVTNTGSAPVTVQFSSATSATEYATEEAMTGSIGVLPAEISLAAGETRVFIISNEQVYSSKRREIENARPEITSFAVTVAEGEIALHDFTLTNAPVFEAVFA